MGFLKLRCCPSESGYVGGLQRTECTDIAEAITGGVSHQGEIGRIVQERTHRDQIKDVIAVLPNEIKVVIAHTDEDHKERIEQ